jgi:hypothetical protein
MRVQRTEHTGDERPADVPAKAQVMYWIEGDNAAHVDRAESIAWGLRGEPGRVEWYAVVPSA